MSIIIAEAYTLELKAWLKMLVFYKKQLETLKQKLIQAIKVPILIRDMARLETYQVNMISLEDFFFEIEEAIQQQLEQIDTKYLFDDVSKNQIIERQQLLIRHKLFFAEKKYLSFRFTLSQYLISIFEVVILARMSNHLPNLSSVGRRSTNIAI